MMWHDDAAQFRALPALLAKYAEQYMVEELGLAQDKIKAKSKSLKTIALSENSLTAVMGLGGTLKVMVAFSFEKPLSDYMVGVLTQGLKLSESEMSVMRYECAGEVLNICAGNVMSELHIAGDTIALSPPVVIAEARTVHCPRDAAFFEIQMTTEAGVLHMIFAAPADSLRSDLTVPS